MHTSQLNLISMLQVPFWKVYSYSVGQELEELVPHLQQPNMGLVTITDVLNSEHHISENVNIVFQSILSLFLFRSYHRICINPKAILAFSIVINFFNGDGSPPNLQAEMPTHSGPLYLTYFPANLHMLRM